MKETPMIRRTLRALFARDDRAGLEAFHRAELRDAGVTDHALRAFCAGR
jgi:hypothetical protein